MLLQTVLSSWSNLDRLRFQLTATSSQPLTPDNKNIFELWLRLHNTGYNVILYFLCCYNFILNYLQHVATISSLILDVATTSSSINLFCYKLFLYPYFDTTSSSITLCCYNLILHYSMLLQPHTLFLVLLSTTSS